MTDLPNQTPVHSLALPPRNDHLQMTVTVERSRSASNRDAGLWVGKVQMAGVTLFEDSLWLSSDLDVYSNETVADFAKSQIAAAFARHLATLSGAELSS